MNMLLVLLLTCQWSTSRACLDLASSLPTDSVGVVFTSLDFCFAYYLISLVGLPVLNLLMLRPSVSCFCFSNSQLMKRVLIKSYALSFSLPLSLCLYVSPTTAQLY